MHIVIAKNLIDYSANLPIYDSSIGIIMNVFDFKIISYLNQFSQHSEVIDKTIEFLSGDHLLKGGVLITIIWWAWFKDKDTYLHNRTHIISTLLSCIIAIAIARFLQLTLAFRARPMHEESLHFVVPHGVIQTNLDGWSSFPSDHTALFFALATGICFISKKMGAFALFYTTVFIALPRIYLGLHYPTDIIVGAIIGINTALIMNTYCNNTKYLHAIEQWSYSKPAIFYPVFFLLTYQIVDLFDSVRKLAENVAKFIHIVI
ncbi:Phosphoesterase PA-phosphatase related protein [Crenothrix polyspora]|uniref:undecaprenyl-diphosphate phosphatase n=2 Tax=Crenothrix polyspora TaxID=360316 RepID=A0A1R4HB25_9GAMM|nr:Phosphoesterase PA-phosphatase related protein [Crenothrix polyspora]